MASSAIKSIPAIALLALGLGQGQDITWTQQTPTPGWPGFDAWLTVWYEPLSQRTIFYVITDASTSIYSTDVFFYDSGSNTFSHLSGTGSLVDSCTPDSPSWPGDRHPGS